MLVDCHLTQNVLSYTCRCETLRITYSVLTRARCLTGILSDVTVVALPTLETSTLEFYPPLFLHLFTGAANAVTARTQINLAELP